MSFVIRVKNADFSSIRSAVVTDSTANTSGLQSFFRLKSNTAYAQTNLAYKGNATVVGSPTLTSLHASVTGTNYFQFNTKPTDASRTIAIVVRGFSAPTAVHPAGSWAGSPTTNGAEYFEHSGLGIGWIGTVFNSSTGTHATNGYTGSVTLVDNRYDLLVLRVDSPGAGGTVTLHRPRDSTVRTYTYAAPNTLTHPNPAFYTASMQGFNATTSCDVALFAHWNRALSDSEIAAFYQEQKNIMASHSL